MSPPDEHYLIQSPPGGSAPAPVSGAVTSAQERQRGFNTLFISLLCVGMGQSLFFAVLPPLARELGLTEVETGAIFALSAVLWVVMSPFWGRRSDTWGRKPIILVGLFGFAVSTLGFALVVYAGLEGMLGVTAVFFCLVAVRSIFGTFGSGTMPGAQAYVADRTTRSKRSAGVASIAAAFGVGTVIGPGFASMLVSLGILTPFFVVSFLATASAVLVWYRLPERTAPMGTLERQVRLKLTDRRIFPILIMEVALAFSQTIVMQITAFYFMDTLELAPENTAQLVGVSFMAMAMAALFVQVVFIRSFDPGPLTLIYWGGGFSFLAFVLLVAGDSYGVLTGALVFAGLGFGMLRPGLMAAGSLLVSSREQGAMAGLLAGTAAVGHILNPVTGMPLYGVYPQGPFFLGAALMVLMVFYALASPRVRGLRDIADSDEQQDKV
ncbi:MAG: MFS transporter [Parvularculales bacterium]